MNKERRILEICKRRSLKVEPAGKAWRIHGRGIDIIVARIADADADELAPAHMPHRRAS